MIEIFAGHLKLKDETQHVIIVTEEGKLVRHISAGIFENSTLKMGAERLYKNLVRSEYGVHPDITKLIIRSTQEGCKCQDKMIDALGCMIIVGLKILNKL